MSRYPYNTASWQRLREAKLSVDPLCEACIRREVVEPASVVDHVVAINKGGPAFPPLSGLMALCEPCHNAKTNAKDHPNASGFRRALKGYDVNGNPIDPEGWEAADGQPCGDVRPAAFRSREAPAGGPVWDTREDLVLKFSDKESSIWV